MYQPQIYLEVRVLLSAVPGVFLVQTENSQRKDINSVKKDFLKRTNEGFKIENVKVEPAVLHKALAFVNATGGTCLEKSHLEHLTGNILEPPDDKTFTGYSVKVGTGGSFDISFHQKSKKIHLEEIRIEEKSGNLTRTGGQKAKMDWTYAGCPCLRIKTKCDFELGEEAFLFLEELYTFLTYLNLIPLELGESCVRCNAYVSLAKESAAVKLRNLNSFNFVKDAINYELLRQEEILNSGGKVKKESRLWLSGQKVSQSWQERSEDARFEEAEYKTEVPVFSGRTFAKIELPSQRRERLRKNFGLSRLRAQFICARKDRADFFEETVAFGADAANTAHWMAGEFMRLLNLKNQAIKNCLLTPQKFAQIIKMFSSGRINSGMAKALMQHVFFHDGEPERIAAEKNMILLASEDELLPFVRKAIKSNEKSSAALKNGEMASLEFLTGWVMKETQGRAVPEKVKALIKKELNINVIYVLSMGGAFTAKEKKDGTVVAGTSESLRELLNNDNKNFPVQIETVSSMLSEEIEPKDWAKLVAEIKCKIDGGTANGIVVTHGTDTLSYTASLLFWLFGAAHVPVVLTASEKIPSCSDEAAKNLNKAVEVAREKEKGVFVVYNETLYSPLNLKFTGISSTPFANWNMKEKIFTCSSSVSRQFLTVQLPEAKVMEKILNEAAEHLAVIKVYPGMVVPLVERIVCRENAVDNVILELYSSGTGDMRNSDYSLKNLLINGKKKGINFFCTSQQERKIDFSQYETSASVWREGAVPMNNLTTESVVTLYFASYLLADSRKELLELMENEII